MIYSPIRQLSAEVIGQIAAGEVVERPAAAIKELVENSMDAGATAITVEIHDGGFTSFRVVDNGSGIHPNDIRMAFARHATSKISSASDLYGVKTLGFRGEALASIAAVSRVTCTTRIKDADTGIMIQVNGGEIGEIKEAACPEGTSFQIKDIFYNAPVRRKFMKKPNVEASYISELMMRFILSHPQISFRFMLDGKLVYFSAGDGKLESAIVSVYGLSLLENLYPVKGNMNGLVLDGYVGIGDQSRGNRTQQSFILNERLIKKGYKICFMAEYYLFDANRVQDQSCSYETHILDSSDFEELYLPEWSNALCKDRKQLDVLGVGAYDKGQLVGLAGCSADCCDMWQIGVDVLPDYRRRGIASALTTILAREIIKCGKVPFYCSAWSNIRSVRNAIKSGFIPAWVEMTVKPISVVDDMNRTDEEKRDA